MERIHVLYSGQVQGVGFRFRAMRAAEDSRVVGYVKNLSNGAVEIVAEGEKAKLRSFLKAVKENMAGYISDSRVVWEEARDEFKSFRIEL